MGLHWGHRRGTPSFGLVPHRLPGSSPHCFPWGGHEGHCSMQPPGPSVLHGARSWFESQTLFLCFQAFFRLQPWLLFSWGGTGNGCTPACPLHSLVQSGWGPAPSVPTPTCVCPTLQLWHPLKVPAAPSPPKGHRNRSSSHGRSQGAVTSLWSCDCPHGAVMIPMEL